MRRIIAFLLSLMCAFFTVSCNVTPEQSPDNTNIDMKHSEFETVKMLRYNWYGYGISEKIIPSCDLADRIIYGLNSLAESGQSIKKISGKDINEFTEELPVDRGTVWMEVGEEIFRLNPEMTMICRVESHLGKGVVMNMTDTLENSLKQAWYYFPYDYWSGTYQNGEVSLDRRYEAETSLKIEISDIVILNNYDPDNKITLQITSKVDQCITIELTSQQSDDNLASIDQIQVTLLANTPEYINMSFGGFYNCPYYVTIIADNTKIS